MDLRIGVEAPLLNSAAKHEAVSAPQKVTQFPGNPNSAHLFANGARLEGAASAKDRESPTAIMLEMENCILEEI